VLGEPKRYGRLHERLNRREAAAEDEFLQSAFAVMLEETADKGIHKRTIRRPNPGEIENEALARVES